MSQQLGMPGVVVLGSDFKALGVVRSLGRRGIPSIVIDNLPRSAWFSRYAMKRFRWHGPMDDTALRIFQQDRRKYGLESPRLEPICVH